LGNGGYQSLGARLLVVIRDRPLPLADQLIEVVGLGRSELPHREVVEEEHIGADQLAD
jgi:hypothetical protein